MKTLIVSSLVLAIFISGCGPSDETDSKPQTVCPVAGGEIDKNIYADYQGQRIYFCCPACKQTFLNNPDKYFEKMVEEKVVPESTQEFCPVMTEHTPPCFINKSIFTDYKGRRIYFCSEDCKKTFAEDPAKYLDELNRTD